MSLPRVTLLIGMNNSGKTSVLKALQLALGDYSRYLSEEDFYIGSDDKRSAEIVVDVRIVPVDEQGDRIDTFDEAWQAEFGDRIRSDANTRQYVALRTSSDRTELDRILSQLLSVMLNRHRQKLAVYDHDISKFEQNYRLDSNQFQEQFESGALGDEMDLFEWFSLCELRKDLLVKISNLEQAL